MDPQITRTLIFKDLPTSRCSRFEDPYSSRLKILMINHMKASELLKICWLFQLDNDLPKGF